MQTDGRMDGWTDGLIDGRTNGWMDRTEKFNFLPSVSFGDVTKIIRGYCEVYLFRIFIDMYRSCCC